MMAKTGDKAVSARVRQIRFEAKVSQAAFAKSIGVSQGLIAQIESATRALTVPLSKKIAETYGYDQAWILLGVSVPGQAISAREAHMQAINEMLKNAPLERVQFIRNFIEMTINASETMTRGKTGK